MVYFPLRLATLHDVLTEYGTQGSITEKKTNIPLLSKSPRVQRCQITIYISDKYCHAMQKYSRNIKIKT